MHNRDVKNKERESDPLNFNRAISGCFTVNLTQQENKPIIPHLLVRERIMVRDTYPQRLVVVAGVVTLLAWYLSSVRAFSVGSLNARLPKHRNNSNSVVRVCAANRLATEPGLFPLVSREILSEAKYDVIVVGSGNGACGFLSHYLEYLKDKKLDKSVLILEQGQNFFYTSDITHQSQWTKSYAKGPIFKLHNTYTHDGKPILSGGACTMGGGGSINYTMIHESSSWLAKHMGFDVEYWDSLKERLNAKFKRDNPLDDETQVTNDCHVMPGRSCTHTGDRTSPVVVLVRL